MHLHHTAPWDTRNRLTALQSGVGFQPTFSATYTYDAEGHRLSKTVNTQTTSWTVNPHGISQLSEVLVETAPDSSKKFFVYGPTGLLYDVDSAVTPHVRYYHTDQVGSTVALTDGSANVIGRAEYTAYGMVSYREGDTNTPFLYNGAYGVMTDAESGLLHMRARYYHPWMGRFISEDPIGFEGGMNWYAYCSGNPISGMDPLGLWSWADSGSVGVGFVPVVGTLQSAVELVSGQDYITGEPASRGWAFVGLFAGLVPGGKGALKGGVKVFGAGAQHADEAVDLARAVAREGSGTVYSRVNPNTGVEYVGQTMNDARYVTRQTEHNTAGRVAYDFERLGSARPGLDLNVLEESYIRSQGGLKRQGGSLENLRHQMSETNFINGTNQLLRNYQGNMLIGNGLLNGAFGAVGQRRK